MAKDKVWDPEFFEKFFGRRGRPVGGEAPEPAFASTELEAQVRAEYDKVETSPEFHQLVMGNYDRGYLLGYSVDENGNPYVHISVMPDTTQEFPGEVSVGQYKVPIKVTKNFRPPQVY